MTDREHRIDTSAPEEAKKTSSFRAASTKSTIPEDNTRQSIDSTLVAGFDNYCPGCNFVNRNHSIECNRQYRENKNKPATELSHLEIKPNDQRQDQGN